MKSSTDKSSGDVGKPTDQLKTSVGFFDGKVASVNDYVAKLASLKETESTPVSIYLHVPFGAVSYAQNSSVSGVGQVGIYDQDGVEQYLELVEEEIREITQNVGENRLLQQLHFGGQAPNALSKKHLCQLVSIVEKYFELDESTEKSIAACTAMTSPAQLDLISGLGFNRIDFGLTDLNKEVQSSVGQLQSTDIVKEAFRMSRDAGVEVVTSDLVFGLPSQTVDTIKSSLEHYLEISPSRIHCRPFQPQLYGANGQFTGRYDNLPSLADKFTVFNTIIETLTRNGYTWIGLDCFARNEDSLVSAQKDGTLYRNRIGYTPKTAEDCIGFGANALSDVGNFSAQNHGHYNKWAESLRWGHLPVRRSIELDSSSYYQKRMINQLMCNLRAQNADVELVKARKSRALCEFADRGLIHTSDEGITVTEQGRYFMNQAWDSVLPSSLSPSVVN